MPFGRRGLAAVLGFLALALGVVAVPQASAAVGTPTTISAAQYSLSADYAKYNTPYDGLIAAGLPIRSVDTVMQAAVQTRQGLCDTTAINMVNDQAGGFCFDDGDNADCHNVPQGITTSRDAVGGSYAGGTYGGHQLVVVSWYYEGTCGGDTDRSRITLVDWDATYPNTYRKILLVEPYMNGSRATFRDVPIHAGGIAWYGDYLYVADTGGGLRVFNMAKILEVGYSGASTAIGYQSDGTYQAHNYRYVLPQIGTVTSNTSSSTTKLSWSTISLDRGASPASLVMAEYTCGQQEASGVCATVANVRAGRAVRFPFLPQASGGGRFAATTTASQALQLPWYKTNGVASHNGRWWFNSSGDKKLYYWTPGISTTAYPWTTYGESMSYWEDPDSADLIWTLREAAGGRDVFAFKQATYS